MFVRFCDFKILNCSDLLNKFSSSALKSISNEKNQERGKSSLSLKVANSAVGDSSSTFQFSQLRDFRCDFCEANVSSGGSNEKSTINLNGVKSWLIANIK
jgi:hypothetical protein